MKAKNLFIAFILSMLPVITYSQQSHICQTKHFAIGRHNTVNVSAIKTDWNVRLKNFEKPLEGNKAYAEQMKKIKLETGAKYPKKYLSGVQQKRDDKTSADTCMVITGFEGNYFNNSIPNDNTLAIANNGMLISDINSTIYIFDTQNDTLVKTVSLSAFSDTLELYPDQYDPKLLYDPDADKFVMAYLAGFKDSTSNIILAFSATNDPLGEWYLYSLPGNPLADTSWSDFPAIAFSQGELFLTVNLLADTGTWQTSFKQSVVWQINKNNGYNGDTLLSKLWSGIQSGGRPIRNINPIQGGSALTGPDMYLLSTNNFAVQSDTIFLMHISDILTDTNAVLTIAPLISDRSYGMPPNANQPANQTLATNDARILGGFIENDNIQFVGNTIDTASGMAAFYHGIINDVSVSPSVQLAIISDTVEFGYPNISYAGVAAGDNSAIITVNYSGKFTFPGFGAINYNGSTGTYSSLGNLRSGNTHINFFSGTDPERWGDYSGSQRVYNDPGKVWVSGSFGKKVSTFQRLNGTWIAQLQKSAPDAGVQNHDLVTESAGMNSYPNPVNDLVFVDLSIPYDAVIDICLYNETGSLVKLLLHGKARKGKNSLSFNTSHLSRGVYLLTVKDSKSLFLTKKIIKE